ncbi:MAG: SMC-Scp complex subunit ScpB [Acidimicrobiaceae bacterium]|nr:SMC-Scp complex subunit ScpB [Acidimicrobiaceae bacterium]
MSEQRPPVESARGLRLVSDEGRTVADPPAPPEQSPGSPASRTSAQPPSQPPSHPSVPSGRNQTVNGSSMSQNGHAEGTTGIETGDMRPGEQRTLDDDVLYAAIEAVLMVATEPVPAEVLAAVIGAPATSVQAVCNELAREYAQVERGFTLMQVAGGYQLQTAAEVAEYVERFVGSRRSARLSAAAMETLAVVAYKQPVSRAQISAIRGVNADGVVRTLADQGYIAEVARDPGPGNAALLGTTPIFLERLSLRSLDDLPSLAELRVDGDAMEAMDRLAADKHG